MFLTHAQNKTQHKWNKTPQTGRHAGQTELIIGGNMNMNRSENSPAGVPDLPVAPSVRGEATDVTLSSVIGYTPQQVQTMQAPPPRTRSGAQRPSQANSFRPQSPRPRSFSKHKGRLRQPLLDFVGRYSEASSAQCRLTGLGGLRQSSK